MYIYIIYQNDITPQHLQAPSLQRHFPGHRLAAGRQQGGATLGVRGQTQQGQGLQQFQGHLMDGDFPPSVELGLPRGYFMA